MSDKPRQYTGSEINVSYNKKLCIHAAECVRGLPSVFDVNKRPWVQPDQATSDEVAEIVARCPTGALKFQRVDGTPGEKKPDRNLISLKKDGPLYLRGNLEINLPDEQTPLAETRVALCRCGNSKNKPFCDNSHVEAGFTNEGKIISNQLQASEEISRTALLKISTEANGPLLINGPVSLCSANGEDKVEGEGGALCRCGASQNKPFCDGSHFQIGFEAK